MKRIFKSVSVAALLVLVLPGSIVAQGNSTENRGFCNTQANRQIKIREDLSERIKSYDESKVTQSQNQKIRRQKREDAIANARAKADLLRAESYDLIIKKQDTDEEKNMARAFAAEVDAAVSERRQSYDLARATFEDTVENLLASRDTEVTRAVGVFNIGVGGIMKNASKLCENSANPAEVRQQIVAELKQARVDFNEKLRARSDFKEDIKHAVQVRREAYEAATKTFQQRMQSIQEKYAALKN